MTNLEPINLESSNILINNDKKYTYVCFVLFANNEICIMLYDDGAICCTPIDILPNETKL